MTRKIIYSIKQHTRRAIFSKKFLIATLLTSIMIILDYLPNLLDGIYEIDGIIHNSTDIVNIVANGGLTIFFGMIFIAAVIPYSGVYCEDRNDNMVIPTIKRSDTTGYAVGIVIACTISTFLCAMLSQIISALFFSIFVPFDNHMPSTIECYSLVANDHKVLFFIAFICLKSLNCTFFGIFSLAISMIVKNRYVIYATPFIMYYFLMRFGYTVLNISGYLNVSGVYSWFVFGYSKEFLSVGYSFLYTICIMCLAIKWVSFYIRRYA